MEPSHSEQQPNQTNDLGKVLLRTLITSTNALDLVVPC